MRGNVLDLAVGIVIGAAFGSIVNSFVNDILMPPVGLLLGGVDFSSLMLVLKEGTVPPPYETVAMAQEAGAVTINYGVFINSIITFLIVAPAVFMLVKVVNRFYVPEPEAIAPAKPETKECPFCAQEISIKASRCPYCTSQV